MPCVAAIQQQRVGARGADRLDHGGHAVQPADPAIFLRQRREIIVGQRVMRGAAIVDAVKLAEIRAGDMGHLALVGAHADIDLRFAEIDRLQSARECR